MTNEIYTRKHPTHRVYVVTKRPDSDKAFWNQIGAAWAHADGKGLTMRLDCIPLRDTDELVIREKHVPGAEGGEPGEA